MAAHEDKQADFQDEAASKEQDAFKKKGVRRLRVQRQITIDPQVLAQAETFVFQQKQAGNRSMSFSKLVEEAVKKELEKTRGG